MVQKSPWSVLNLSLLCLLKFLFLVWGAANFLWWKSWLWCVGMSVGRDFWGLSIQVPAQSRISSNTCLPAVALFTES